MAIKQSQAVISAVTQVLSENGVTFEAGQDARELLTSDMRKSVHQIVLAGFNDGSIEMKKVKDAKAMSSYVSGLITNWLNKSKVLNGGNKYVAKNPGTRTGSSDPELKALRALLSQQDSDESRAEIQSAIDSRVATLNPTKTTPVDFSALPEHLKNKFAV